MNQTSTGETITISRAEYEKLLGQEQKLLTQNERISHLENQVEVLMEALRLSQRSDATSLIFMNASECTPDKQFRFGLSQFLLDYAGIKRDVMIVGRAGQAEIWDAEEFESFERENLTPEKLLASLEAIGL